MRVLYQIVGYSWILSFILQQIVFTVILRRLRRVQPMIWKQLGEPYPCMQTHKFAASFLYQKITSGIIGGEITNLDPNQYPARSHRHAVEPYGGARGAFDNSPQFQLRVRGAEM